MEAIFYFRGLVCHPIIPVVMERTVRPGLTYLICLHVRHGTLAIGAVLEGRVIVLGVEGMVGVEMRVADGSLQHYAMSCTWGLVSYIVGGRSVLVGISYFFFPALVCT